MFANRPVDLAAKVPEFGGIFLLGVERGEEEAKGEESDHEG